MKRTFAEIGITLVVFTCVCVILLASPGGTLAMRVEIPPEATGVDVEFSHEGVLKAESLGVEHGTLLLLFTAIEDGDTVATIVWDGVESNVFYASRMDVPMKSWRGIVFDGITYNFTGWEKVALCLSAEMIAVSAVLFFAHRREERENGICSYRPVRQLGFSLFFGIIGVLRLKYVITAIIQPDYATVWTLLLSLMTSALSFVRLTSPVIAVFAAGLCISNLVLMKHEGVRPANMLGIFTGFLMAGGAIFAVWMQYTRSMFALRNEVTFVFCGVFVYFECLLTATVKCAIDAAKHNPAFNKDYVLVLGCRIRPDGTLYPLIQARTDRAITFAREQKEATGKFPVLVPSGGKGTDEPEAEAEAIAKYMVANGVPEEAIVIENKSGTTKENLRFSGQIIASRGGGNLAFSTSGYHVFRGGILAKQEGVKAEGMGSRTKWYFWPNAFIREFIGLLADSALQQATAVAVISALCLGLTKII